MKYCPDCGHEKGPSRFCTSCGRLLDPTVDESGTDTAERPAIRVEPAAQGTPPTPAAPRAADYSGRFPLFADEVADPDRTTVLPQVPSPQHLREPEITPEQFGPPGRSAVWPVFLVVGTVLVLAVVVGFWLLGAADDSPSSDPSDLSDPSDSGNSGNSGKSGPGTKTTGRSPAGRPSGPASAAPDNPGNLARTATAQAPVTAPPNLDLSGDVVRYGAANLLDGVPSTAWRMPGDGSGRTLTFTLPAESVLTEVGLINGYAKTDRDRGHEISWYALNRRVIEVEWVFDDGTTVTQQLDRSPRMQTTPIDPVRTTTVRLRLVSVSAPAARNGRNYTPISDVALIGG